MNQREKILALGIAAILGALIVYDGESNWLEGAMLLAVYSMLGLAFYFLPLSVWPRVFSIYDFFKQ